MHPIPAVKVIVRAKAFNIIDRIDSPDPNAPPTIQGKLLSEAKDEVDIILGENNNVTLNLGDYDLTLTSDQNEIIPDFINGSEVTITAKLNITYPVPSDTDPNGAPKPQPSPMPVEGRNIKFTIESGKGTIDPNGVTDPNGECQVKFKWDELSDDNLEDIVVKGEVQGDPNSSPITKTITVKSGYSLAWAEDFESYSVDSWPSLWTQNANASDRSHNHIDCLPSNGNSNNQALCLYGIVGSTWAALAHRALGVNPPYEIRLKIYNGSERLSGIHPNRARVAINKGTSWSTPNITLLLYKGNGDFDGYGIPPTSYSPLAWYSVRIQNTGSAINIMVKTDSDGVVVKNSTPAELHSYDYLTIESSEGSAWFDDIKVYSIKTNNVTPKIKSNLQNVPKIYQEIYDPNY